MNIERTILYRLTSFVRTHKMGKTTKSVGKGDHE